MEIEIDNELLELVGEINRLMAVRDNSIMDQVNIQDCIRLLRDDLAMCVCEQIRSTLN